jgi:type I restriction enzyme R subunit
VIASLVDEVDIDTVEQKVSELLDESVVVDNAEQFGIKEHQAQYQIIQKGKVWDLSKIDFDKLKEDFKQAQYQNIEIADMRKFIETKLQQMIEQNYTRVDFAQKLQEIIDRYNSGGSSTEDYYEEMLKFAAAMKEEDERHIRLGLTEDELELFDTLSKENMTQAEEQKVELAAKHLITRLLEEHPRVLVQDWWKDGQTQRKVKDAIEEVLDSELPEESYVRRLFKEKCDNVYELVVDFASHGRKWASVS